MPIYSIPLYTSGQYGGSEGGSAAGQPTGLTAYSNVTGSAVLYWKFEPCSSVFSSFEWRVDTDTVPTFDSANLLSYTSTGNPSFIQGYIHAGISVPTYTRSQGESRTMYWRVKGVLGGAETVWSSSTYEIPEAIDTLVSQQMLDSLPDVIYKKDFTDGESNLFKIYRAIGTELDRVNTDAIFAGADAYTVSVRDTSLDANFGTLLQVQRPNGMKAIDYREILRVLSAQAGASPSVGAVKAVIASIFCDEPTITFVRDQIDMYVADDTSSPVVDPFYVDDATSTPTVDPGTIWDNASLAFGVIIDIVDPLSVPVTRAFVEGVVDKVVPAFSPVYLTGI